jgi:hypothetical protein
MIKEISDNSKQKKRSKGKNTEGVINQPSQILARLRAIHTEHTGTKLAFKKNKISIIEK